MEPGMTTALATQLMTAEEFALWVQLPENTNRWFELVRGEVIELPPPTRPHGVVCSNAIWELQGYVRQRGYGYVACNDAGVILSRDPDTVRGPDVAVYEDAGSFAELHPRYGETPPLLAVEVLSPEDRASRLVRKITDYLGNGVRLVWVIDPETQTLTVHAADRSPVLLRSDAELTGGDVLPGFRCPVAALFVVPGGKPTGEKTE
jgi:Uma2 family endonuclease